MKLNKLIDQLLRISAEHGDLPVRLVVQTDIPAMSPSIGTKTVAKKPAKVREDEGVVFIEGGE